MAKPERCLRGAPVLAAARANGTISQRDGEYWVSALGGPRITYASFTESMHACRDSREPITADAGKPYALVPFAKTRHCDEFFAFARGRW